MIEKKKLIMTAVVFFVFVFSNAFKGVSLMGVVGNVLYWIVLLFVFIINTFHHQEAFTNSVFSFCKIIAGANLLSQHLIAV